jgi:hypothetical protein
MCYISTHAALLAGLLFTTQCVVVQETAATIEVRGAQVRIPWGLWLSPHSSTNTRVWLNCWAFF